MPRTKKATSKGKSAARKGTKTPKALKPQVPTKSLKTAGKSRAEGIRLFKLAGRPTKEQFVLVYGERGPRMTWDERAKAGVSAKQFQAALAAKQAGR